MAGRAWHRREVDWDGPITLEVDRSFGEGRPFAPRIPRGHGARLHLRVTRPESWIPTDADVDRVTALVEAVVSDLGGHLVARTHRPDRSSFVAYLPTRSSGPAKKRLAALTEDQLAPFAFQDVIVDRDEVWDFYLFELLPEIEDWSMDFPSRAAAATAGARLAAMGLAVGEPLDLDVVFEAAVALTACGDQGTASWDQVHAVVAGCGGRISGHGTTM